MCSGASELFRWAWSTIKMRGDREKEGRNSQAVKERSVSASSYRRVGDEQDKRVKKRKKVKDERIICIEGRVGEEWYRTA
jgi:hypothetical protein